MNFGVIKNLSCFDRPIKLGKKNWDEDVRLTFCGGVAFLDPRPHAGGATKARLETLIAWKLLGGFKAAAPASKSYGTAGRSSVCCAIRRMAHEHRTIA